MIRALALAAALWSGAAAAETIRIGTEAGYPPFMSHDATGGLQGFDKDLGDALCAILAADCVWVEAPFDSLIPDLAAGRYDIVIAALSTSPTRRELVDFTQGYREPGVNIGVFAGLIHGQPVDGARIGVQSGTVHADYLIETGRDAVMFADTEAALQALLAREIDLVFSSGPALREAFETRYPQLRMIAEEEVESWETAIALPKGREDLRARLDAAISALRDDGTLDALEARWFVDGTAL